MSNANVPQGSDIARAMARLENRPEGEGYVSWRMTSPAVNDDDWHSIEYDVDDGWNFDLAPFSGDADQLLVYADDVRDLALALSHLKSQGSPLGGPGITLRRLRELAGLSRRDLSGGMGFHLKGRRLIKRVETGELTMSASWFAAAAKVCAEALLKQGGSATR